MGWSGAWYALDKLQALLVSGVELCAPLMLDPVIIRAPRLVPHAAPTVSMGSLCLRA